MGICRHCLSKEKSLKYFTWTITWRVFDPNGIYNCISRVPKQNGVSLLYIMLEIHHSGREPSISFGFFLGGGVCVPQLYLWGSPLLGEIFAHVTVF